MDNLEQQLSQPSERLVEQMTTWDDGLMVLGAGGKMGPTLCRMAANAFRRAGRNNEVYAVSRFTDEAQAEKLQQAGVRTIRADLMNPDDVAALPNCKHIVFAAGRKFGSAGAESLTWAMNVYMPGLVASRFPDARFVVFSSGNVYPFVTSASGGCDETVPPNPVGEYAQSVLGRERIFEHFSVVHQVPVTIIRLNYAVEPRYGVLVDLAETIAAGQPVDLSMGHFNVIWQRDANEYVLRSFALADVPPTVLNVTGPETVATKWAALQLAQVMDKPVTFVGEPSSDALLNNASRCFQLFGYPDTSLGQMIKQVGRWVAQGGTTHSKPTGFQVRDGQF